MVDFPASDAGRLKESAVTYSLALAESENAAIQWLAKELSTDSELRGWFFGFLKAIGCPHLKDTETP